VSELFTDLNTRPTNENGEARYAANNRNAAKMDADRKTDQEKADADRKADMEEMEARLAEDGQAEQRFLKEMIQIMDTSHKEIMAEIIPRRNMETIACQEMEAHPEEEKPSSVDMKP
jgi:hypothetical protein